MWGGTGSGTNTSVGTCDSGEGDEAWDNGSTGKFGASLDFDGTNDEVSVDNNPILGGMGEITVSAWVYPNSTPGAGNGDYDIILSKLNSTWSAPYYAYQLRIRGGTYDRFEFYTGGSSNYNGTFTDSDFISYGSTWYHLVGTYDGSDLKLYVDGVLESTVSDATIGSIGSYSTALTIGDDTDLVGTFYNFDGQIDELSVYNYALTQDQVRTLYNNGAVRFD